MTPSAENSLAAVREVVRHFRLESLFPALQACEAVAGEGVALDIAVLGQFKAGKSSFLNALVGIDVFPVGALPVTAVVTRATGGPALAVRVTFEDGRGEEIEPGMLREFVTEVGNPGNVRRVRVVDVFAPALLALPGIRLVDTPGLGSLHRHNTEATLDWLPNAAAALVLTSAERPLSDEDGGLVDEVLRVAPRVWVVVTKIDLLSDTERAEVMAFVEYGLRSQFGARVPALPFSTREDRARWVERVRESVLRPLSENRAEEKRGVFAHKLAGLTRACRSYLEVALAAAERTDQDRERLRAAVLSESVSVGVIRDELRLAEQALRAASRPAFEKVFLPHAGPLRSRLHDALRAEIGTWRGGLAVQVRRYEQWLRERLQAELAPLSEEGAARGAELLGEAEVRFRRVVEAFRDRVSRNLSEALGVSLSPVHWEPRRPALKAIPVAVGKTFDTQWDLLSWLLPMSLVGWLFRRHVLGLLAWETEKNLQRLVSDWTEAAGRAVGELREEASFWVEAEIRTLGELLARRPVEAAAFRAYLDRLGEPVERAAQEEGGTSYGRATTGSP